MSNSSTDLQELVTLMPHFTYNFICAVYQVSNLDFAATFDCLHNKDGTLEAVVSLMKESVLTANEDMDPPRIRIATHKIEDWVESAFSFYKGKKFNTDKSVRVTMQDNPSIDAGGVRRDFYSRVYEKLASGYLGIFEGKTYHLRPAFTLSVLTSDTLKHLGAMVGHSILMDKIGFPYISPSLYYYMADSVDTSITLVSDNDVSDKTRYIVKEVCQSQRMLR